MPRGVQNGTVPICLIEQNPLGLEYLLNILRKDPSLRIRRIENLAGRARKEAAGPVIIVDNCGLPLPLSECLRRLRFRYPEAKYVVLDHRLSREDMLCLLGIRVDGFLPYGEVPRSLLTAVHSVAEGNIWIPREVLRAYVQRGRERSAKAASSQDGMTPRENQIIELVKRRLSNQEIADILRIRESTVKFHLSNIYSKLHGGNRRDLIASSSLPSAWGTLLHGFSRPGYQT
jgi:DNA-binding NarL/FixJ family response regulator